jgi:hypothetical protein
MLNYLMPALIILGVSALLHCLLGGFYILRYVVNWRKKEDSEMRKNVQTKPVVKEGVKPVVEVKPNAASEMKPASEVETNLISQLALPNEAKPNAGK